MQHAGAIFAIDDDHRAFGAFDHGATERERGVDDIAGNVQARAKALALQTCIVCDHRH